MIDKARDSLSPRAIVLAALGLNFDQQLRVT
jgi:hypothetical protein